tara:strand:- start:29924 stop:30400 length:477 start_codon:yes stop_codon:yes gene_type:complete
MIRTANLSDLSRVYELLLDAHNKSKYNGHVQVDEKTARALIMHCVQRQGLHNGSTNVSVVEKSGKVEGFMIGILDRVYHIGDRLVANDLFLVCTKKAGITAASRLVDDYVKWAEDNPKVFETKLSWTDALGVDAAQIESLYAKKGFVKCGGIWGKELI